MDLSPQPPTASLPPLRGISSHSLSTIVGALINLRALYWPTSSSHIIRVAKTKARVPDSGYASADEDELPGNKEEEERLELLRADELERAYAIRWLTGFIARSGEWVDVAEELTMYTDKEYENRTRVVDEAITLLALSADTHADGALTREFRLAVEGGKDVVVKLKDESYDADHEGVGLQTWGSACVLAERICSQPEIYLGMGHRSKMRVLELGAGTGLLSIALAKLCAVDLEIVATDYHLAVLANLLSNVALNAVDDRVDVRRLDWSDATPAGFEDHTFNVILAADVIYNAQHGKWIKACAERMLAHREESMMWLIIPRRPTRKGEVEGVGGVFDQPLGNGLKILSVVDVPRQTGVGRADEAGYRIFKIGWGVQLVI